MTIAFHEPFRSTTEKEYIYKTLHNNNSLFRGVYHKKCTEKISKTYNNSPCFLTNSCTEALLMATMILNLSQGDEVIISSFTFVSVANILINRGCVIRFADNRFNSPFMDIESVKSKINSKTKAVIDTYYGGYCIEEQMKLRSWCKENNIFYIADAAHAFHSYSNKKLLGLESDITVFSFHETKSLQCGQGGMLMLNIPDKLVISNQIYNHGTDKISSQFNSKQFYQWTKEGFEFNLNELSCALLWSQLEFWKENENYYKKLVGKYLTNLKQLNDNKYIHIPDYYFKPNKHISIFYIVLNSEQECKALHDFLISKEIDTRSHYYPLHLSEFYKNYEPSNDNCPNASDFAFRQLRLPLYPSLTIENIDIISNAIIEFYDTKE
jgi:dTDP-4-amino-4,6-dideoxygalactose transaminase